MKKIVKLEKRQEDLIPVVAKRWIDFFKAGRVDPELAVKQIQWLYGFCKMEPPSVILVDSPFIAQIVANLISGNKVQANVLDNVWDNVLANVRANVRDNVEANVLTNVQANVLANVWDNVWANVQANVRDNVEANVLTNVRANVRDNVLANVRDNVWANVQANVRDNVEANVLTNVQANVLANVWDNVWANVQASIRDNVEANVLANVRNNVLDNVLTNVRANVLDNVLTNVRANVLDNVWDNVWANVQASVRDNVEANVLTNVRANVRDNVLANVRDNVRDNDKFKFFQFAMYGNLSDYGWLSFYDYFSEIGFDLKNKDFYEFKKLILSGVYDMVQFEKCCIAVSLPLYVKKDNKKRMHCTDGPAILFRDGYAQYYWKGTCVPQHWIEKPESITKEEIIEKGNNAETRRVLIEILGVNKYFDTVGAKNLRTIDTDMDNQGNPMTLFSFDFEGRKIQMLEVTCPSTKRVYNIAPPNQKSTNVWAAKASICQLTEKETKSLIHES